MNGNQIGDHLGELLLVQTIFRHGARTPLWQFPGNPNGIFDYPEGLGALSANGKEQKELFRLGQVLQNRYNKYLDGIMLKNINAQSSPLRRCHESALSVLGGLFPPAESQIWSQDHPSSVAQHWQPIGVTSSEASLGSSPCAEAAKMEKKLLSSEGCEKFLEENQDILKAFSEHSGLDAVKMWLIVVGVCDTIVCEKHYFKVIGDAFKHPEWFDKIGPDTWERLMAFRNFVFARTQNLPKRYFQLRTGPVMKDVVANLNRVAKNTESNESESNEMFLYSTHDTLLAPLLQLFGFNKDQPGFGSGLIFELRRDPETQQAHVHLFYVDGNKQFEIEQLHLHQSDKFKNSLQTSHCSVEHFVQALQDYLPEENGESEDNNNNPFKL